AIQERWSSPCKGYRTRLTAARTFYPKSRRVGDSLFSVYPNSGAPVYGEPGSSSSSTLQAGALESTKVDLTEEHTNMIVTQRADQANAREITVSGSMLEELVALKC
ncbi:MAG TPA: flagellar basal body rod C-terminal domain-containing protein, partial [Fibrobacteraceae bacterium]|nr:flagellar basal body rod C-terminal domain-containing protein [Fibrobacteraceae bacterium]